MGVGADPRAYEEMINALQTFLSDAEEECTALESAAEDCVDNMEEDPVAEKACEKVNKCVSEIRGSFETIQGIIRALQEELDEIRRIADRANFD